MAKEVLVPPLGQTTAEVTLVHWYKREGDAVQAGEPLYAIETDKAVLDVEAPASGVLRNVSAAEGQTVPVLQAIAVIAAPDEVIGPTVAAPSAPAQPAPTPAAPQVTAPVTVPMEAPSTPAPEPLPAAAPVALAERAPAVARVDTTGRRLISPRARRLAEAEGLELSAVAASGPEGALVERDIRAALAARAPTAAVRARVQATDVPALLMVEADMTQMLRAVAQLQGTRRPLTLTDLLERVLQRVAANHPGLSATLVHRPDATAQVLPATLTAEYSAALGVGRIVERPWVVGGQVAVRPVCWLTLTYDARALSQAEADALLGELQRLIEQPALLLA